MRFIKLAIISIIVIFIILTAMSSLLPSQILVSRAIDIRGSVEKTKQQLFQLQNWQNWMTDENGQNAPHSYNDKTGVLSVGPTTIQIISASDTTLVTKWLSPNELKATFRIISHNTADSLFTVQWQMEQDVKWYPWEKFASITKDELWGGSMQKSLENLQSLVDSQ